MQGQGGVVGQARDLIDGDAQALVVVGGFIPIGQELAFQSVGWERRIGHKHIDQIRYDLELLLMEWLALAMTKYTAMPFNATIS